MMNQSGWQVKQIEVQPGNRVLVTMALGSSRVQFHAPEFGIGRPGKETAALAKFAARSGMGDVEEIYEFLSALPENYYDQLPLPLDRETHYAEW